MGSCRDNQFDVIVVGGGIMGSSTAYELGKRGKKTLLLEQFDFLHHRGSSHGESRTIRATYPQGYYYNLVVESSRLWEEAESEIGFRVYFKSRHLDIGPSDNKSLCSVISNCKKYAAPHQILTPEQLASTFSCAINVPENWVGVITELGGVIKPTKAVSMFQTLAYKNGAVLKDNTRVIDIKKAEDNEGVCVHTSNGEKFWGRKCVLTTGAWTKELIKRVGGYELPIQVLETTVCYWRTKEGNEEKFAMGTNFPTFASYAEPYIYGTPSLEFPGLIKIAVHGGKPCDPDKRPWGPGISLDSLKAWIEERFCGLVDSNAPVATQLCMYSMTPDEDFVIDFLGGEFKKDVVVGGGFSGHGFKMGPVVGRILADLVINEVKGEELKHFAIKRFEVNPKGNARELDDKIDGSTSTVGTNE